MSRILIADDAPAVAEVLRRLLAREGHDAQAVSDGESALQRMRSGPPPDLLIADLTMPGITGADLVRTMADDPRLGSVPVVLMSGRPLRPEEGPAAHTCRALLAKPFSVKDLLEAVQRALGA